MPKSRNREARSEPQFERLKPGPGRSPAKVRANQRARLHRATVALVADHGYRDLTVRALIRTSGVSTRTFYEHFSSIEGCFISTYRAITDAAVAIIASSVEQCECWEDGFRAGIQALLGRIAADPAPAQLALVDAFDGGPALLEENDRSATGILLRLTDPPARVSGRSSPVSTSLLAGAERVVRSRLLAGRHSELPTVAEELGDWILVARAAGASAASLDTAGRPPRVRTRPVKSTTFRADDFGPPGSERARLLAAAATLAARHGYRRLTLTQIRKEAGVSRQAFDQLFPDVEHPFLEATGAVAIRTARDAWNESAAAWEWREGILEAARALCAELAARPELAQIALLGILEPGQAGLRLRECLTTQAATELDRLIPAGPSFPRVGLEASVAAALDILRVAVAAGDTAGLVRLAPTVASLVVGPYAPGQDGPSSAGYQSQHSPGLTSE